MGWVMFEFGLDGSWGGGTASVRAVRAVVGVCFPKSLVLVPTLTGGSEPRGGVSPIGIEG